MKKLKTWQLVLLIIFYPAGIVYLIYWLYNRYVVEKNLEVAEVFYSNVVGTVYPNSDGTTRQAFILPLKKGDDLFFKPAPTKDYPDSIGVFTKKGKQIGVVAYPALNKLRGLYAKNIASVCVNEVMHSEQGLGVSMQITVYK